MSTTASATSRTLALEALIRVEAGEHSNVLLPQLLRSSRLDDRDRAFTTDLVYGTLRQQGALDWLLARVLDRPLPQLDPAVRAAVRLGAYQLVADVPAHAAVSETVDALGAHLPRARGFVNGTLRALARLGPDWPWPDGDDPAAVAVRTSHPEWLVEQLSELYGSEDARAVLDADNVAPPVALRPNPARTTAAALEAELVAAGITVARGVLVPDALVVRGTGDPARLPAVAEGRATPQDQASQAVVRVLDPQPGERVLDVAAAPGGKATAIAELLGADGVVIACDLSPERLTLVRAAACRLALATVRTAAADARALPFRQRTFDRVLVDAPCTGLGVLRRRAEARWRARPSGAAALAALQRDLLHAASMAVRPGGTVVYAVCTLTEEETRGVDEWAGTTLPDLVAEPPPGAPWRPWGRGALLLPHLAGTDGMFVLHLQDRHGDGAVTLRP